MASFIHTITRRFHRETNEQPVVLRQSASSTSLSMGRSYSTMDRPTHLARVEQAVNEELLESIVKTIRLNERKLQQLELEGERLTAANISLKAEITNLTVVLEEKWLQRGQKVALAISDLFHKFQALDQDLTAKRAEAERISNIDRQCVTNNGKDYDWNALQQRLGPKHAYLTGASLGIKTSYGIFSGPHSIKKRCLAGVEQLHRTFGDTFPIAVRARVQKIKEEALSQRAPPPQVASLAPLPHAGSSAMVPFQPMNAIDNVFCRAAQEQADAKKDLKRSNLQLQEENESLTRKKEDLRNIEPRFADYFRSQFCSGVFGFHETVRSTIWSYGQNTKDHPRLLAEMDPWGKQHSYLAGLYTTELELANQISSAVREMDQLVSEIEKGCPEPYPT